MEDILLSEEPLVSYDKVFLRLMERNNIISSKQLVEAKNIDLKRLSAKSVQRVRGLIDLLKYKYNSEDLMTSPILNKNIVIDSSAELKNISEYELCRLGFFVEDLNYFRRFNFYLIRNETKFEMRFIEYLYKYLAYDRKAKINKDTNISVKRISDKIELLIDFYNKREHFYEIETLKKQLKEALHTRDEINKQYQIDLLEEKIENN